MGCVKDKPALCPDGICYEDYSHCEMIAGCTEPLKPLKCPSGECVVDFDDCEYKEYKCPLPGMKKCSDSICRYGCDDIHTNGCPSESPFYCPIGKCVKKAV